MCCLWGWITLTRLIHQSKYFRVSAGQKKRSWVGVLAQLGFQHGSWSGKSLFPWALSTLWVYIQLGIDIPFLVPFDMPKSNHNLKIMWDLEVLEISLSHSSLNLNYNNFLSNVTFWTMGPKFTGSPLCYVGCIDVKDYSLFQISLHCISIWFNVYFRYLMKEFSSTWIVTRFLGLRSKMS